MAKKEYNERIDNLENIPLNESEIEETTVKTYKEQIKEEIKLTRLQAKLLKEQTKLAKKQKKLEKKGQYQEFSKKVTIASVILAYYFVIFVSYEIHTLQVLDPIAYIGTGIVLMLAICVRAYMKRAYQQDLVNMKVNQSEKLSQLKREYGDNFIYEGIEDVNLDS